MTTGQTHVIRALHAEAIRTAGRGPLWTVLLPAATLLPLAISVLIAYVAEQFARIPGQHYIQQVTTTNSAYWVISITVTMTAVAASYGLASEFRHRTMAYVRCALPRRWTVLVGTWLYYGVIGAIAAAALVSVVLVALPLISPQVYGPVSITDPAARRLLWTVPVFAFFAAGFGVGIGTLIRTPAAAVGAILFWVYVIETAVGYLPGGFAAQQFMPFLNGVFGTGQDIVLDPPWGPNIALAYVGAVFSLVFLCGWGRLVLPRHAAQQKGRSPGD